MSKNDKLIAKLKSQRAVLVDQQERAKEFLEKQGQNATLASLEVRLTYIENQMEEFLQVQSELEGIESEELQSSQRASYEETYFTLQPAFTMLIQKLKHANNNRQNETNEDIAKNCSNVRLPKISLPSFDGEVTEWTNYFESFKVLIHEETSLNNLQKYQYLKSTLVGPAAAQIASLELNSDNYNIALNILKNKYANKRLICQAHLDALLNIKPISSNKPELIKRFVDQTNVQLRSLEALERPAKQWDDILVHIILHKLDAPLRSSWEDKAPDSRLPTLQEVLSFLNKKCESIEATRKAQAGNQLSNVMRPRKSTNTALVSSSQPHCLACKRNGHYIHKCHLFVNLPLKQRLHKVQALRLCSNCLRRHDERDCKSVYTCAVCKGKHHTLLHSENLRMEPTPSTSAASFHTSLHSMQPRTKKHSYVFLATVVVNVIDSQGNYFPCRAILDSASQLNFVSQRLVQQLGLKRTKMVTAINGVGNNGAISVKHQTNFMIKSRFNNFSTELNAVILPNITSFQPSTFVDIRSWNIPNNIQLSDPEFNKPNRIDLLIGAELHYQLLQVGQITLPGNSPVLQKTVLGWIVSGKTEINNTSAYSCNLATEAMDETESLTNLVRKFWELESHTSKTVIKSREETLCENHYQQHYKRDSAGRFIVKIPFREDPICLGDTIEIATRRFLNLERRIHKNQNLLDQYKAFIHEYCDLKHMRKLEEAELLSVRYMMPHHCVVKPDSSSTKLRVVFDASAKSTSNKSLNDIMMIGPTIQQDLFSIILRFRVHQIAITADISKMYRQILVDPDDCVFQNIVWRDNPTGELQFFQLQTVTYGTAAAPFLSTRSLLQLALDEELKSPIAFNVIQRDFYVDDMITGTDTLEDAQKLENQVRSALKKGGFELRKWCSNNTDFLSQIIPEHREKFIQFSESDVVKTLGLIWDPQNDTFNFKSNLIDNEGYKITKRTVLADIARLFDPLGFINPVIVLGKIFLQQLWKLQLSWDESLPVEYHTKWTRFRNQLGLIQNFTIPRRLCNLNKPIEIQLHAFSDASEKAYGSCLYLRCEDEEKNISTCLLCAKSRVAPLHQTTIPRLELCAAQLMAQLTDRVIRSLTMNIHLSNIFYWTDSQIVLSWLSEPSSNWCTFVANRVANIQELTDTQFWRHVDTKNNPADLVSRGLLPEELITSALWLKGPNFLRELDPSWMLYETTPKPRNTVAPERRKLKSVLVSCEDTDMVRCSKYLNSFNTLQGVFAYINRFITNCKSPRCLRKMGQIDSEDREAALIMIVKIVQQSAFKQECHSLENKGEISKGSHLRNLHPFLDKSKIIRVGGRLQNASLSYDAKHPMLLPSCHPFTKTLMAYLHSKNLHAGQRTLLAITRQRFWPISGANIARKVVHSCIICFRAKPRDIQQLMGNLPSERVQPARPFVNSGVDFCGPVYIHYKRRGKQPTKAYIAIFVCFATKAVHFELVSDLTSAAFIAALKRFIGRRGLCSNLFCDNATNFIGANKELRQLREIFLSEEGRAHILEACSKDYKNFHYIPPRSPHFGGLWEAAVKLAKYHLRRVTSGQTLTFEELNTTIIQIEAILNSRPIQAMSTDPNDLTALTPGHFLIGEPLNAVIEPGLKDNHLSNLGRWQRIQLIRQHFWQRWSTSYLNELQCRKKWTASNFNVSIDRLVIIKEDNVPPMKWHLGRVVDVHPGDDGKVRVVTIKTSNGLLKRSITKICPLPIDNC